MRSFTRPLRAAVVITCIYILTALPGVAAAESYVQAGASSAKTKLKAKAGGFGAFDGPDGDGQAADIGARLDFDASPFFALAGIEGARAEFVFDPSFTGDPDTLYVEDKAWGYSGGFGYILNSTSTSELAMGLNYTHLRTSVKAHTSTQEGSACCGTSDAGRLYLGFYNWLNSVVKIYGDVGFVQASHDTTGHGIAAGLEFAVTPKFRLFAQAGYGNTEEDDNGITYQEKTTTFGGGIKIPFGSKPAPAAAPRRAARAVNPAPDTAEETPTAVPLPATVAPATPVAPVAPAPAPVAEPVAEPAPAPTPPPPVAAVGSTAKLNPGAQMRGQPKSEAAAVDTAPEPLVILKAQVANAEGKWWYVSTEKGGGWVKEGEFTPQP